MERFGFVGMPNSGKSSLFNALAGGGAEATPYATKGKTIGRALVPDDRLTQLAEMSASRKVIPATLEFIDIGGLTAGSSSKALADIREADAIVYVLRAFVDPDVAGSTDPLDDLDSIETELCLTDLETCESQLPKRAKAARSGDKTAAAEIAALERAAAALGDGTPLYRSELSADERESLRSSFLLTDKKVMAIVNLGEADVERGDEVAASSGGSHVRIRRGPPDERAARS